MKEKNTKVDLRPPHAHKNITQIHMNTLHTHTKKLALCYLFIRTNFKCIHLAAKINFLFNIYEIVSFGFFRYFCFFLSETNRKNICSKAALRHKGNRTGYNNKLVTIG